jgi:hypothetical protein
MITDWATYKQVTGDRFTAQADAESALQRAQNKAQDICQRTFELGTYTETLEVVDGKVWPRAYPVRSATLPTGATIDGDRMSVSVSGSIADAVLPAQLLSAARQFVTLTYVGGWDPVADPWLPDMVPTDLTDIVCELASRYAMPANTVAVPAGVSQVSVNGQSFGGAALGGSSAVPVAIRNALRPYWHITRTLP